MPVRGNRTRDEVDRIGEAFNRLLEGFAGILGRQRTGAGTVLQSADGLKGTVGELEEEANRVAGFSREAGEATEAMARELESAIEQYRLGQAG